jgi:hypothetical protein
MLKVVEDPAVPGLTLPDKLDIASQFNGAVNVAGDGMVQFMLLRPPLTILNDCGGGVPPAVRNKNEFWLRSNWGPAGLTTAVRGTRARTPPVGCSMTISA